MGFSTFSHNHKEILAVFCISTVSFLLFSNSLNGDFVYDDRYHLLNTVLHCVCTGLLYYLLSTVTTLTFECRCLAALLFGIHPVHTEAVSGLVGRAELLATSLMLLAIICYIKCYKQQSAVKMSKYSWLWDRNLLLTIVLTFCSMLSKEQGITTLGLCFVLEIMPLIQKYGGFVRRGLKIEEKDYPRLYRCLVVTVCCICFVLLRLWVMGMSAPSFSPADNPASHSSQLFTRFCTFLYLPVFNFLLLVCPVTLSFDWSMESIPLVTQLSDYRFWFAVAFYAVFVTQGGKLLLKTLFSRSHPERNGDRRSTSPCLRKRTPSPTLPSPKFDLNSNILKDGANYACDCCSNNNGSKELLSKIGNFEQKIENNNNNFSQEKIVGNGYKTKFKGKPLNFVAGTSDYLCEKLTISETSIFGLAFLIITFTPATNLLFYVGFVVAERVLYMPSIGYCILFAVGYHKLKESGRLPNKLLNSAILLLLIVYGCKTFQRNFDWRNEESLYKSGAIVNPAKAYSNLGNVYSSKGLKSQAETAYRNALKHRPNMADTLFNLGTLLQGESRFQEAVLIFEKAIAVRQHLASAHLNLGLTLWSMGRLNEAAKRFSTCSALSAEGLKDPRAHLHSRISCLYNLGRLRAHQMHYKSAISTYSRAIELLDNQYPSTHSLYNLLGDAYLQLQQLQQAEYWFGRSLHVKPDHVPAHLTSSNLLIKLGKLAEAEKMLLKAVQLAPADSAVMLHMGRLYIDMQTYQHAIEYLLKSVKLDPHNFEAQFSLANAYRLVDDYKRAEEYYSKSVVLRPLDGVARTNYGAILHANGKLHEAELQYLEALQLNPDDHVTKMNLVKLKRVMQSS